LLVAFLAGEPVDDADRDVRRDAASMFADDGPDTHDVEVDVDAVGHGLPVGVLADEVLVEEPEGLRYRRRRQADEMRVEVLQDRAPLPVDRAVAFVDDHEVEGLRRDLGVVLDLDGVVDLVLVWLVRLGNVVAAQHHVEALHGADHDVAGVEHDPAA
jgi:hypothetical protein